VNTARGACGDKESLQYATLCSAAGSAYYELNQLGECRKNWEKYLEISEAKLEQKDLEVSTDSFVSTSKSSSH
jgi:hypothetical protein